MDKAFSEQLELAKKIVASWPKWKQTSLLVTAMAKQPKASAATSERKSD